MAAEEPPDDSSSLVPAITLILSGIATYAATQKTVKGYAEVAKELQIPLKLATALASISQRTIRRILQRTKNPRARAELNEKLETVVDKAVADGIERVSKAVHAIVSDLVDYANSPKPPGRTSPAGEKFDPNNDLGPSAESLVSPVDVARKNQTARDMARRTYQTVVNGTEYHAAEEAGWPRIQWKSKKDWKVRPTHIVLDGQSTQIGTPFVTIHGNKIRYPHDPLAPMSETQNCRCWVVAHYTKSRN